MLSLIQKHFGTLILVLIGLLGLSLGHLAANGLEFYLSPPLPAAEARDGGQARPTARTSLHDYDIILERNIFDSTAPAKAIADAAPEETSPATAKAKPARGHLKLFGTVSAGENSLALIEFNGQSALYHLDDRLPDDRQIIAISRHEVTIRDRDNTLETLPLEQEGALLPEPAPPSGDDGMIRAAGDNRWIVDRQVAENARNNVGQLLRTARMVPNMVGGQTEGFVVKMIRPRSLLDQLGLREGDIVMQVNGMELSSPEKALRVFQQLREAEQIAVDLVRGGTPLSMVIEIN